MALAGTTGALRIADTRIETLRRSSGKTATTTLGTSVTLDVTVVDFWFRGLNMAVNERAEFVGVPVFFA